MIQGVHTSTNQINPLPSGEGILTLHVENLACRRGGRTVFEDLSFTVTPGAALLVEGANGSGKSSLLRILAGLLRPAAGRVDNPHRVAFLGHLDALKLDQSPRAELRFWARLDGADAAATDAALERFDLAALAGIPIRLLSSGQRRRLALARVWQSGAPLWLLDEPSNGLDAPNAARLAEACTAHCAAGGLIVAATHHPLGIPDSSTIRLGNLAVGD